VSRTTKIGPGRIAIDLERFIAHRRHRWQELESLLERIAEGGDRQLGRTVILDLVRLYRLACSDLNQARSCTANPELLGRLNQLVGRAYRIVYREAGVRRGPGWMAVTKRFLVHDVPLTFSSEYRWVLTAALMMLLGALVGFAAVVANPANGTLLIPEQFFNESPAERVEKIEAKEERIDSMQDAAQFSSQLYTHNIQVSFLAFSLGALTIVGGWMILFYNGVILGAVAAMYLRDGVGTFFLAWVGPHGALELPAIVFAGAAGLRMGQALLMPGDHGRAAAVRGAFTVVWRMLLTGALVLVAAGLIEGSFSQFSAKTVPYAIKITVALMLFTGLCLWLFRPRRVSVA
jgi:uncharacterized membrane protein SpoIIM required for sporulation